MPEIRFEATVHAAAQAVREAVAELDLDRLPDRDGAVRVLITAQDAARLLDRDVEVRLLRALPVRPLDRSLVLDDDAARGWLEERTRGLGRERGD